MLLANYYNLLKRLGVLSASFLIARFKLTLDKAMNILKELAGNYQEVFFLNKSTVSIHRSRVKKELSDKRAWKNVKKP
jgi:hypothetical protein